MFVLSIETSCDETSIALLQSKKLHSSSLFEHLNSFDIISSIVSSQIDTHKMYGGVIPEIGARMHADSIHLILMGLLKSAGLTVGDLAQLDGIFVTSEPGLISALRVGIETAKSIQFYLHTKYGIFVPLDYVHHLKGHVASSFYQKNIDGTSIVNTFHDQLVNDTRIFPHIHLIVSGGNSQILLLNAWNDWKIVGQTLDDAAGECFDKIGRMLGFPYPAGIYIAKTSGIVDKNIYNFPIGMQHNKDYNYSFSGLKTHVRRFLEKSNYPLEFPLTQKEIDSLSSHEILPRKLQFIKDVAISAQTVIISQLVQKVQKAIHTFSPNSCGISGGVSANLLLRLQLQTRNTDIPVFIPPLYLTGDNAIMIALAGIASQKYS